MAIRTTTWQMTVTLIKLVQRKGSIAAAFTDAQRTIDLTPMLGEQDRVSTVKNIMSPAGGFTITLADRFAVAIQDTIYTLVEPMDQIEIRASRTPWLYAGKKLPLIMRGFVSTVRRSEGMGEDGKPQRVVVVQGLDSGKFWQIHQVLFMYQYATEYDFITPFQMNAATQINGVSMSIAEFTQKMMAWVNNKISVFSAYTNKLVLPFNLSAGTVPGQAFYMLVANVEGPAWTYIEKFADRPWNEVFTRDSEAGPVLVFRETPFYDINGKLIMPNATDPGTFPVEIDDVVALDVGRSDDRVANFYFVPPSGSLMGSQELMTASALASGQPIDTGYGNDAAQIYGERMMTLPTSLVPDVGSNVQLNMLPPGQQVQAVNGYIEWWTLRQQQLKAMNRDNILWEEGTISFQGTELAQHGQYLQLHRGALYSKAYVPQVSNSFAPLGPWITTASMVRGTGFQVRDAMTHTKQAPFWAEGRRGPYSLPGKNA